MSIPLQITFHGLEHSDAVEQHMRERLDELERFYPQLSRCRVAIEAPHRRHRKGNLFSVHLDLHLRGQSLTAARLRHGRQANEDIYLAIREAFEAAQRRLIEHKRERREHARQAGGD